MFLSPVFPSVVSILAHNDFAVSISLSLFLLLFTPLSFVCVLLDSSLFGPANWAIFVFINKAWSLMRAARHFFDISLYIPQDFRVLFNRQMGLRFDVVGIFLLVMSFFHALLYHWSTKAFFQMKNIFGCSAIFHLFSCISRLKHDV